VFVIANDNMENLRTFRKYYLGQYFQISAGLAKKHDRKTEENEASRIKEN